MTPCSLHTQAPAGWSCTSCHRALCPDCTGWRGAGRNRIDICMRCGSMATRLRTHRSLRDPLSAALPRALLWPLSAGGLVTLLAVALVVYILELSGNLGGLIGYGVALAYFFQLVRHTAAGHDDVPAPSDFRGFFDDVVGPVLRALLASIWFVSPIVIWYVATGHPLSGQAILEQPLHLTPLPLLLFVGGALLYPMAIIGGALGSPLGTLLNPFAVIGLAIHVGRDYWLCSIFCLACAFADALVTRGAGLFFTRAPLPLHGYLAVAISLYLPFVSFRAMGLLVRARGDALGYGRGASYQVPILDAEPMHEMRAPEKVEVMEPLRSYAPIEIALGSEPGVPRKPFPLQGTAESAAEMGTPIPLLPLEGPVSAISLPTAVWALPDEAPAAAAPAPAPAPQPAPAPSPEESAAAEADRSERRLASRLAQRMAARDLEGARQLMRAGAAEIPAGTLSAQSWMELARSFYDDAARAADGVKRELAELAILACRRGVEVAPDGPLAPRTWLLAARTCDEMLRERPRSNQLLAELAKRFPATPEGSFALKRLGASKPA